MELSIVIPCHNEEKNIPLVFEKFHALQAHQPFELIVVNNASTDASLRVMRALCEQKKYSFIGLIDEPTPGYGRALVSGLRQARGSILAWTHADLQTDPADVLRGFVVLKSMPNPDRVVVKGRRVSRRFGAWAFTFGMSIITSLVLRGFYSDINAQPKIFTREFFKKNMLSPPEDFSLDLYLLAIAKAKKYPIVTFPVIFSKRMHGSSSWAFSFRSRIKTILRTLKYIFRLRKVFATAPHAPRRS